MNSQFIFLNETEIRQKLCSYPSLNVFFHVLRKMVRASEGAETPRAAVWPLARVCYFV